MHNLKEIVRRLTYGAWPLVFCGCTLSPGTRIEYNDFELAEKAAVLPAEISTEQAHSGTYAMRLTKEMPYSPAWNFGWEQAQRPHKIRVQAWVRLPNHHQKTTLVVEVVRDGKGRYWKALNIHEVVKRFHQWEFVWKNFVLPRDIGPNDSIRIYLWQADQPQVLYFDDFTVEKLS